MRAAVPLSRGPVAAASRLRRDTLQDTHLFLRAAAQTALTTAVHKLRASRSSRECSGIACLEIARTNQARPAVASAPDVAALAPGNDGTLRAPTDLARRPPQLL